MPNHYIKMQELGETLVSVRRIEGFIAEIFIAEIFIAKINEKQASLSQNDPLISEKNNVRLQPEGSKCDHDFPKCLI